MKSEPRDSDSWTPREIAHLLLECVLWPWEWEAFPRWIIMKKMTVVVEQYPKNRKTKILVNSYLWIESVLFSFHSFCGLQWTAYTGGQLRLCEYRLLSYSSGMFPSCEARSLRQLASLGSDNVRQHEGRKIPSPWWKLTAEYYFWQVEFGKKNPCIFWHLVF